MFDLNLSDIIPRIENDDFSAFKSKIIEDYWIARVSRECSILCRKEVLNGKAKFGVGGSGKELAQIALAKVMQEGDWKSGYYRDQTFMISLGLCSVQNYFAQLYADSENDIFSGGRQMNNHFSSPIFGEKGEWLDQTKLYNISADISCTAGQVGKALGLAFASNLYKKIEHPAKDNFTKNGGEVSFCTIGDASTSEGAFWETMNAAAVLKVPLVMAIWDDGFGISVPIELQTVKASISKAMAGFQINETGEGIYIFTVKAWDYQELCTVFEAATNLSRKNHIPCLIHVEEVTQPLGHSSSGSHERYKSEERLQFEKDFDCLLKMSEWMVENNYLTKEDLEKIDEKAHLYVKQEKDAAWVKFNDPLKKLKADFNSCLNHIKIQLPQASTAIDLCIKNVTELINPVDSDFLIIAKKARFELQKLKLESAELNQFISKLESWAKDKYNTKLFSDSPNNALDQKVVNPIYSETSEGMSGYSILNKYFDDLLTRRTDVIAFGEDVGTIGDVNQGFAGLNHKHGNHRVFDAGIREWTIIGQAIGAAMRGLRPIAEIQYLDYINYAVSPLSDDLACMRYRTNGTQAAPAIIRSRGHRLEGIWHTGSPMGLILTSMKGIYLCVPRNMVQAIGMYNTLINSDDPAILIECLNGYRLKETLPDNYSDFTVPLGRAEVLRKGSDVTMVSYGSTLHIVLKAAEVLMDMGVNVEVIDVQTLMPFDLESVILESIKKTNRVIFIDEDVPGGATAYMMSEVVDKQNAFRYLDAKPLIISAKEHRTPYGTNGDYFGKPNQEEIVEKTIELMKY
jgi:pyruvate/2-oxoglutarate/acetoin dehydrogenase E1 component/TPP-dependent pyruvate/acetoin dehydrogenase alpha subunit